MKYPNTIEIGLSFEKGNDTWKAIHMLIDASIESEVEYATSKDNKGEDRAWHCGRADALRAFKEVMIDTRNNILNDQGRPLDDSPSENGI